MELEQLKKSWDKLSEKLDREEVLRKQELRMLALIILSLSIFLK